MSEHKDRGPVAAVLRVIVNIVVGVFVVGYTLLDDLLFPLFRPLIGWLSGLKLFEKLGALIQLLPPYAMLVVLAVPFVLIEPLKIFALWWIASGHIIQGGALLIVSHILSILILERLYHTGHDQLMRIGWFKTLMSWLVRLRDIALGFVTQTAAWRWVKGTAAAIRAWLRGLLQSAR